MPHVATLLGRPIYLAVKNRIYTALYICLGPVDLVANIQGRPAS